MQGLQEGLVVANICIRQVPSHLHGPPAQVPRLNQVSLQPADHVQGEKAGESDRLEANMRTLALRPGTGRNRIGQSGKAGPLGAAMGLLVLGSDSLKMLSFVLITGKQLTFSATSHIHTL